MAPWLCWVVLLCAPELPCPAAPCHRPLPLATALLLAAGFASMLLLALGMVLGSVWQSGIVLLSSPQSSSAGASQSQALPWRHALPTAAVAYAWLLPLVALLPKGLEEGASTLQERLSAAA